MHIILALWTLLAAWRWGDWKNWERYYPTMLYIVCMNLLYQFFQFKYFGLWVFHPDFILNGTLAILIHGFLINPLSVFLFLSNYPTKNNKIKRMFHYIKWCLIFLIIEWIGNQFGAIAYHNGWHFGWSIFFVIVMFPMLRLHYVNKLLAIPFSVLWILFYLIVFDYI